MVQPENIDSGYPNFQLDTRSSGSRRNLDYLSRCSVTVAASPYAVAHAARIFGGEALVGELAPP